MKQIRKLHSGNNICTGLIFFLISDNINLLRFNRLPYFFSLLMMVKSLILFFLLTKFTLLIEILVIIKVKKNYNITRKKKPNGLYLNSIIKMIIFSIQIVFRSTTDYGIKMNLKNIFISSIRFE